MVAVKMSPELLDPTHRLCTSFKVTLKLVLLSLFVVAYHDDFLSRRFRRLTVGGNSLNVSSGLITSSLSRQL
jgi:hypothetical protein